MNELYELMKKSEVLCSALPEIVDRMVSLEALHDEGKFIKFPLNYLNFTTKDLLFFKFHNFKYKLSSKFYAISHQVVFKMFSGLFKHFCEIIDSLIIYSHSIQSIT